MTDSLKEQILQIFEKHGYSRKDIIIGNLRENSYYIRYAYWRAISDEVFSALCKIIPTIQEFWDDDMGEVSRYSYDFKTE